MANLPKIKHFFAQKQPAACEVSPANLLIWQDFDRPQITLINDNLCLFISPINEKPFFLEPLGNQQLLATIETALNHCGKISRVTETFVKQLPQNQFKICCLRAHFDYLYETKVLAELKGRRFDGKRNHIKRFRLRHQNYTYQPLQPEAETACLQLFEEWFAARQESRHFPRLARTAQRQALVKAFKYFKEINCRGGVLKIEDQVKGFIMGSPLNDRTISVHFQYGHPSVQGIFPTLLWEACNKTFADFNCLNLEQDLGIPGLRQSKLSYSPELVKKFEITPRLPSNG
ncbi:DUF2156 domain-containing protein [Candidatus Saganbacteria bacterium]|nr:DUF2156 domain-containing protein [Candidatus Saganbacteria bacterium]